MEKINRIKKYFFNASVTSLGSIVLQAISVFFSVFVSKKIGPEAMGLFTLTKGIYGFGITVATSGINLAVVRLVSSALPYNMTDKQLDSKENVFKIMKNAAVYALSFSSLATVLLLSLAVVALILNISIKKP